MKASFCCTIFLLGILMNASAQEVLINGKPGERMLVWNDFTGTPDQTSSYFASTYWNLNYKYSGVKMDADTVSLKGLELTLQFDGTRSWLKEGKATDDLLKHEQGHFDIGKLCQLEILVIVKTTVFYKADFKTQLKTIFNNTMEKYKALGRKYDEETNHSINKEKQEEWNNFLLKEKERLLKLNQ